VAQLQAQAVLIGLGQIGCGYDADLPFVFDQPRSSPKTLSHARALACHPGFQLVAGIDPDPLARDRFERIYRRPAHPDLETWSASLPNPCVDLAVIAVHPGLQPLLLEKLLLLLTPRALLLEKPVAINLEQVNTIVRSCATHPDLIVAVNYIRRYLPVVKEWRQRLHAGDLGRLLHGQITYGKGLLSNGSHFVNLAEFWLGPLKPKCVLDFGVNFRDFDQEASVELIAVDHANAPVIVRSIGWSGMRAGELDLWFEKGRLCWCNNGQAIAYWPKISAVDGDTHSTLSPLPITCETGIDHYQYEVFSDLYKCLNDQGRLACELNDSVRTLETLVNALRTQ
jgi:predicted dehydrogenase